MEAFCLEVSFVTFLCSFSIRSFKKSGGKLVKEVNSTITELWQECTVEASDRHSRKNLSTKNTVRVSYPYSASNTFYLRKDNLSTKD